MELFSIRIRRTFQLVSTSIVDSLKETMLELQEQYNDPVRFSPERDRD